MDLIHRHARGTENGNQTPETFYAWVNASFILMSFIVIVFGLDLSVDCHSPSPPPSGYILPYLSTLEGATLTYVCWSIQHGTELCGEVNKTAVCTKRGQWEPSADDICTQPEGVISIPLAIISTLQRGGGSSC